MREKEKVSRLSHAETSLFRQKLTPYSRKLAILFPKISSSFLLLSFSRAGTEEGQIFRSISVDLRQFVSQIKRIMIPIFKLRLRLK
jgi:hypothetical protein